MKKHINFLTRKSGLFNKSPYAFQFPHVIKVEPTTFCNLKCPLCVTGNNTLRREKGSMSVNVFKKIVDEAARSCTAIQLSNFGENFLNKNVIKMIRYARQKNISNVSTFSNFLTVGKSEIEEVVDSGLNEIIISIDGKTQSVYEKFRVGGNLKQVVQNVKSLVEIKKHTHSQTPVIEIQCLLTQDTEKDIENIKVYLKGLGVNRVKFKSLFLYEKDFSKITDENIEKYKKILPVNKRLKVYDITSGKLKWRVNPSNKRCTVPWFSVVVTWDGKVLPCCVDWHADHVMGNITKEHFSDIWNGEKFRKFRKSLLNQNQKLCDNCPETFFHEFYIDV